MISTSIDILKKESKHLSPKDRKFAKSLVATREKHGHLSVKQADWVNKLADKIADNMVAGGK